MQTQYINELLDIPELKIHQILSIGTDAIHIATPIPISANFLIAWVLPTSIELKLVHDGANNAK